MPAAVRAIRGATTVDADHPDQITERTTALLEAIFERNGVDHDDLISIWFTVTQDVTSAFPATVARHLGLGDVPLLCACEIPVVGSLERCIRVLVHLSTERPRAELHHPYLEGAVGLRDDLPA
ncbi:MAG: chorismate mutase [Acidimicrobiales bacterium]